MKAVPYKFLFAVTAVTLIFLGCAPADRDIKDDFAKRIEYLRTTPHHPEHYIGGFEYEIFKTDSITKPYRAEVSYAKYETSIDRDKPVIEYRATLTRSGERNAIWSVELIEINEVWHDGLEQQTPQWKKTNSDHLSLA